MIATCSLEGCGLRYKAKGLCNMHYRRLRKSGSPGESTPRSTGPKPTQGTSKTCPACRVTKHVDDFHKAASGALGRHRLCKPCRAEYRRPLEAEANIRLNVERRKRYAEDAAYRDEIRVRNRLVRYGLSGEQWEQIFDAQGRVCAICKTDDPGTKQWATDHDHSCCPQSGRTCGNCTRAILCTLCNSGIGMFGDDPEKLMAAARYLLGFQNVLASVS